MLVGLGLWLRRAPAKAAPDTPKVFDRLANVGAGASYIGGILIADYQGSVLAAERARHGQRDPEPAADRLGRLLPVRHRPPALAAIATIRSARAEANLHRTIDWIMRNRRPVASWICLIGGLVLFGDGLIAYVEASG